MRQVQRGIDVQAPVAAVYEFFTNPNPIRNTRSGTRRFDAVVAALSLATDTRQDSTQQVAQPAGDSQRERGAAADLTGHLERASMGLGRAFGDPETQTGTAATTGRGSHNEWIEGSLA